MTTFVRPAVAAIHAYVPGEQPQGAGWVKLNTNENPYPPSPRVVEAIRAAAGPDLRLYPDPVARRLRQRAAEVYGIDPDGILVGNGSDELLSLLIRAIVAPGTRVAYPTPTYSLYDTLVAIEQGVPVTEPYAPDFSLPGNLADLDARLTFICHPNSPSGVAVPVDGIRSLARASAGVVVVDEAYVDFAAESAMPLVGEFDNVVVLRTFSKSFSLAGMRVGLAFGPPALIQDIARIKDSYNVDRLALAAAEAALEDYAWMQTNVARVVATREVLTGALRERGFTVHDSATNFVLARRPGVDQGDTYRKLKEKRVLVRHFATPTLADALRITVGTDDEIGALLVALDAIA
jgi:histidinol-phosphate aminotransferase